MHVIARVCRRICRIVKIVLDPIRILRAQNFDSDRVSLSPGKTNGARIISSCTSIICSRIIDSRSTRSVMTRAIASIFITPTNIFMSSASSLRSSSIAAARVIPHFRFATIESLPCEACCAWGAAHSFSASSTRPGRMYARPRESRGTDACRATIPRRASAATHT